MSDTGQVPIPRTGCCFVLSSSCLAWKEWEENSGVLNFCSSHLIPKPPKTLRNGLWKTYRWFWKQQRGEGPGNEAELCVWKEHELPWFMRESTRTPWSETASAKPSEYFKAKPPASTQKIMRSWQSVTWQRNFPKTSLENRRSFPAPRLCCEQGKAKSPSKCFCY